MEKELTPKQLTSEAIRQADSILILTGQNPSVDQVASTIALAQILRAYGKKVSAVVTSNIPTPAQFLDLDQLSVTLDGQRDFIVQLNLARAEVDTLKYTIADQKLNIHIAPFKGGFAPADVSFDYGSYHFDVVVVLGVPSYARIDAVFAQNREQLSDVPLINIDYHRSNEQFGAVNLVDPNAASLGEILVALAESLQTGIITAPIATTILTGIMSATDRFTASHTTSKAMTVAAQMMAMGADQRSVVAGLYKTKPRQQSQPRPTLREDTAPEAAIVPTPVQPAVPNPPAAPALPTPLADIEPELEPLINHRSEPQPATTPPASRAINPTNNPTLLQ